MGGYKYSKSAQQVLERSVIPFVVFQRLADRIVPLLFLQGSVTCLPIQEKKPLRC